METLHTIRKWLDRIVGTICILLFALMVVVGSYQIITRFIFNNPSTIRRASDIFICMDGHVCNSLCIRKT